MTPEESSDRPRLILALARARGWKIATAGEGRTPSDVLGSRWGHATPAEKDAFERELAGMEAEPALAAALLAEPDIPGSVRIADSVAFAKTQRPGITGTAVESPVGPSRGRYEVKKEHARGGMGRVLVVLDREVGREVAMKELLPKYAEGLAWDQERFLREARITGQLEHPNIVPVYEIGTGENGAAYYTMKLVHGETMEARLERIQKDGRLTGRQRLAERLKLLDAFIDACNAVGYAHSRGVVNRDLKPANIMIGDFGETVVLDWGLARKLGQEEAPAPRRPPSSPGEPARSGDTTRLTLDGDIMGTPAYMSPEQARGDIEQVDERSDVYALGAMLYEIVTGRPPFQGQSMAELLRAVIQGKALAVNALEPFAPLELGAVAAAAMEKDRSLRLASARGLAEEVEAWRDGRPMALYRHTAWEQLRRFARHNRALALAIAGALLILVAGAAVSLTYARMASNRAASEHEALQRADERTEEARRAKEDAQASLKLAQGQRMAAYATNLLSENATAALLVAMEAARKAPGSASNNALWCALSELLERRRFLDHADNVTDGEFSPDGKLLATAGADFTARIWDLGAGKELRRLEGHRGGITIVKWSGDGKLLLTVPGHPDEDRIKAFEPAGSVDVAPRVWEVATGKCLLVLRGHKGFLRGARWAPGGRVLSWSEDGTARLWDAAGRATTFTAPWPVHDCDISGDGRWITASKGSVGLLWRADDPEKHRELTGHTAFLNLSFSADSKFIVTVDHAGRILRRDVETLAVTHDLRLEGPDPKNPRSSRIAATRVEGVLHHPDGTRIAFHADTGLHIWTADLSRELSRIPFEKGRLGPGMLDPDWKRALIVDGPLAWERDVETGADLAWFRGHEYNVEFAHFSPDGRSVATGGRDHTAIVWDSEPGACLPTFRWHASQPRAFVSSNGTRAVVTGVDGRLEVHDNATGALLSAIPFEGVPRDVRFFGNGDRFAAWSDEGKQFRVGDASRGWLFELDPAADRMTLLRASANGDWLLVGGTEGKGRLWNVPAGKIGPAFKIPPHTYDFVAVSDDGLSLAMVESSGTRVVLYDASSLKETARLLGHTGWTISAAFAPDGTVLTTAMDATVRAWNPETGAALRSGRWPLIQETYLVLSPAGNALALDGGDTGRFYRLDTLDEIAALPRGFAGPPGFSGDGRFASARRGAAVVHLPMDALAFAESVVPRELTPLEQKGMSDSRAEAEAYGKEYQKRHPHVATMLRRGDRALAAGNWEEALLNARDAADRLASHPAAYLLMATAHAAHAALLKEDDPARAAAIEEGMKALEQAEERGYRDIKTLETDPGLAVLRGHARWAGLVVRAKKEAWE